MKARKAPGQTKLLVNMQPVKEWAADRLGPTSVLRRALERERDTIPAGEFVAKLGVWLQILDAEESRR